MGVTEGEAQEEQFEEDNEEFASRGEGAELGMREKAGSEAEAALGESVPLDVTADAEMVVVGAVPEDVVFAVPLFGDAVAPTLLDAAADMMALSKVGIATVPWTIHPPVAEGQAGALRDGVYADSAIPAGVAFFHCSARLLNPG